ncbi:hypothetical protein N7492_010737 [Penicillium capsulatum]|uniref:Uncharacterized protein n=1 Tax=Penicillium capsulatum TaxID=69766 RepID=A0A9W9HK32_9EURO|nr:hypothetical protein N7492_010737 [Penicillium capsulatum]KAJ6114071.1 hypothetical protein N7512_007516 [Penicillium capsulatum]
MAEPLDYKSLWERAEGQRRKAEDERRKAEKERDLSRKSTQPSTFAEFIRMSHVHLSQPLSVQTDLELCTKGPLTSPVGRSCPTFLRPWTEFQQLQEKVYTKVLDLLEPSEEPSPRLFTSIAGLQNLQEELHLGPLASEEDLRIYSSLAVENQVHRILEKLKSIPESNVAFPRLGGISFENHYNALRERRAPDRSRPSSSSTRSNTDGFCVHQTAGGQKELLTTMEYKAPHKLTSQQICAGLREMDLWKDVVQQTTIPIDSEEKLQYIAKLRVGTIASQAHDAMLKDGMPTMVVSTGIGQIYFHIPEERPEVLEYFYVQPNTDVESIRHTDWALQPVTVIGRMLSFCLMSLTLPARSQAWRNRAIHGTHTWRVDVEEILKGFSEDELRSNPSGSEYFPSSPLGPSPASQGPTRPARVSCQDGLTSPPLSDHSDSDNPPGPQRKRALSQVLSSPTPGPATRSRTKKSMQSSAPGPQDTAEGTEVMEYCTQRCLLGLWNQDKLDADCPNVTRHRKSSRTQYHMINRADFLRRVKAQLDESLDHYIAPTQILDSSAVLSRVSLMPYGYTFVSKGTPDECRDDTIREAEVYGTLRPYQGSAVPICLGKIDLQRTFFVHPQICIKHMLLLSWGGKATDITQIAPGEPWESYERAGKAIQSKILGYSSMYPGNILWDPCRRCIQLVNFDSPNCRPRKLFRKPPGWPESKKRSATSTTWSTKRRRVR